MADLFGVKKAAISKHIKNIYACGELEEKTTVSKMETVRCEGDRTVVRLLAYYDLDLIISVGFGAKPGETTATPYGRAK